MLGPGEVPVPGIRPLPPTDEDILSEDQDGMMSENTSTDQKSSSPSTNSPLSEEKEEKDNAIADEDEEQQNDIFIALISISTSFTLLSIILCPIVCCRKPKTFAFEDKKELVSETNFEAEEDGRDAPPYTATYNGQNVQAWFPDYKAARTGSVLRTTSSIV